MPKHLSTTAMSLNSDILIFVVQSDHFRQNLSKNDHFWRTQRPNKRMHLLNQNIFLFFWQKNFFIVLLFKIKTSAVTGLKMDPIFHWGKLFFVSILKQKGSETLYFNVDYWKELLMPMHTVPVVLLSWDDLCTRGNRHAVLRASIQ